MLVTCTECNTSFTLEDRGIKKAGSKVRCSRCKNIFVVYPPESYSTPAIPEEFDALEPGSGHEEDFSEGEEIDFDELDKMLEADEELELEPEEAPEAVEEEPALPGVGDIDFSELEKALDTDESLEAPEIGGTRKKEDKPEEELDLDELDKALGMDEDLKFEEISKLAEEKPAIQETGDLGLSELEEALGMDESPDAGEAAETEEDLGIDEIPKLEEVTEVMEEEPALQEEGDSVLSGLEKALDMDESAKAEKTPETEELVFDELDKMFGTDDEQAGKGVPESVEEEIAGKKGEAEEPDLAVPDKIISSADEPEQDISLEKAVEELELDLELEAAAGETPAGEESGKAYQDTQELDFSDLENILAGEKPGDEKEKDTEQELEFNLDLETPGVEAEAHADEVTELDFSDVDKMLEMEGMPGEQEKEPDSEVLELQLGTDDSSGGEQAGRFADTLVSDEIGFKITSQEPEQEDVHMHLEGFEIDNFQETREIGEKKAAVVSAVEDEKDKKEVKKAKKPIKITKPSGKFIIILGIIVILLLGAGAFVVYNPFDIEIPFVSDFLGSKADEKGNLKITPVAESIKGDYVDTKLGTLFVIKGNVKNDYKNPRSYIKVVGKLYAKGKKLSKTETVFCGNILPEQDIANLDPAVLKKRLLNRSGDKKSNVKVKPGSTIPFMIIYENPSLDLDEFTVEAEGSMKE